MICANPFGQFRWQPSQHWMSCSILVGHPLWHWIQLFVVHNTIYVSRWKSPILIRSELCRLEQMEVDVLSAASSPSHRLPAQRKARNHSTFQGVSHTTSYPTSYTISYIIIYLYRIQYRIRSCIRYPIRYKIYNIYAPSDSGGFFVQTR